jgi:hypothetical protein
MDPTRTTRSRAAAASLEVQLPFRVLADASLAPVLVRRTLHVLRSIVTGLRGLCGDGIRGSRSLFRGASLRLGLLYRVPQTQSGRCIATREWLGTTASSLEVCAPTAFLRKGQRHMEERDFPCPSRQRLQVFATS